MGVVNQAILIGKGGIRANGIGKKANVKSGVQLVKGQFFTCEHTKRPAVRGDVVIRPLTYIPGTDYSNDKIYGIVLENTKGKTKVKVKFANIYSWYVNTYLT